MTNREIKDMLVADLFCLRATTESNMMLFCDNNCDGCKWLYQRGTNGERIEMLKILIDLLDSEYLKEITKEKTCETEYKNAFNMLVSELGLDYYDNNDLIKIKYIRDAMVRILRNEG